ncbi:MAG: prepilin-type N-terminal cleavage/methylation domain-containing protein [Candidatus Pacebacteria bacterium]|nr:prepilin-type N-terminal cleavage/methylation domain-containing protein [Candidatus Paceibacterota bacterium]
MKSQSAFTLVELLIVIGIVAVLSSVVILVINPTQVNKQSRDSQRMAELGTINSAIAYYVSLGYTQTGTTNTVYTSLPSAQADCSDLGLPALPAGWDYACVTSANYRKIDGTGWIPVDFTQAQSAAGALFTSLPIDPVNTVAGGLYYTYVKGSWALSAALESTKYLADNAVNDGGATTTRYEIGGGGDDLATNQAWTAAVEAEAATVVADGLIHWWKTDEGTGSSCDDFIDSNDGTIGGTYAWTTRTKEDSSTVPAVGMTNNGYINVGTNADFLFGSNEFTIDWWMENSRSGIYPISKNTTPWQFYVDNSPLLLAPIQAEPQEPYSVSEPTDGTWHHFVYVRQYDPVGASRLYIDGVSHTTTGTADPHALTATGELVFGNLSWNLAYGISGAMQSIKIYNRALTSDEVLQNYNAEK